MADQSTNPFDPGFDPESRTEEFEYRPTTTEQIERWQTERQSREMTEQFSEAAIWLSGVLVIAAVFGTLGRWVAMQHGRSGLEGAVLGILFGPLGIIVEALLPSKSER